MDQVSAIAYHCTNPTKYSPN